MQLFIYGCVLYMYREAGSLPELKNVYKGECYDDDDSIYPVAYPL